MPIRVRLTLPFAFAMALVLAGTGAVVYVRVGGAVLANVDQNLRSQAVETISHLQLGGRCSTAMLPTGRPSRR